MITHHQTLTIEGDDLPDHVVITHDRGQVSIHLNDETQKFDRSLFKRIRVDSMGGNDHVVIRLAIRSTVNGGAGDDLLETGGRADVLDGGAGNDTLLGFGGRDSLVGGDGFDLVSYRNADQGIQWTGAVRNNDGDITEGTVDYHGMADTIGNDVESIEGSLFNDQFTGETGTSIQRDLIGLAGNDFFHATDGSFGNYFGGSGQDDVVFSEGSQVTAYGGSGDDTFGFGEFAGGAIDGGRGINTLDLSSITGDPQPLPLNMQDYPDIERVLGLGVTRGARVTGDRIGRVLRCKWSALPCDTFRK